MAEPSISVSATGRATTTPDRLVIGFVVAAVADDPAAALQEAASAAAALRALLDRRGVGAEQRTTTGLAVNPRYDHNREQVTSHHARYALRVVLNSVDDAGPLLHDAVAELGASLQIEHMSPGVSDALPLIREARDSAVRAAIDNAEQLAAAAGVRLGALQSLEEHRGMDYTIGEVSGRASGLIDPGEHEVTVTVSAVFALQV